MLILTAYQAFRYLAALVRGGEVSQGFGESFQALRELAFLKESGDLFLFSRFRRDAREG
jgi:hypothetical protein